MADNKQPIPGFNTVELGTGQHDSQVIQEESSRPAADGPSEGVDRRQLLVLGAIIATIVVVLVVVVGFVIVLVAENKEDSHSELPDCQLMSSDDGFEGRRLLWSKNGRAIADFSGFFSYSFSDSDPTSEAYLEFRFESIRVEENESGQQVMTLSSDCAELGFVFEASNSSGRAVESVQVKLAIPLEGDAQCVIKLDGPGFRAESGHHYECDTRQIYSCTIERIDEQGEVTTWELADLYIPYLEFEIDGDPEKTKQGEFSSETDCCYE